MPVTAWDPTPYPDPRRDRIVAPGGLDLSETPEVIVPRVYPWAVHIRVAANDTRGRVASRQLRGPALIKSATLQWQINSAVGEPTPVIALYYDVAAYTRGAAQSLANEERGTPLWSLEFARDDTQTKPNSHGLVPNLAVTTQAAVTFPLNYPITLSEFFLGLALDSRAASEVVLAGSVLIYENIDPRYVGRFMV